MPLASEGARWVAEKFGDPRFDSMVGPLLEIASKDGDEGARCNILYTIGTEGVRKQYGDLVESTLLAIALGSAPAKVRAATVRALGEGGYRGTVERVRGLESDASPRDGQGG